MWEKRESQIEKSRKDWPQTIFKKITKVVIQIKTIFLKGNKPKKRKVILRVNAIQKF